MTPLRPTQMAVRIRDICNHWPQYSNLNRENVPAYCNAISFATDARFSGQQLSQRQVKQAYLQSLHKEPANPL